MVYVAVCQHQVPPALLRAVTAAFHTMTDVRLRGARGHGAVSRFWPGAGLRPGVEALPVVVASQRLQAVAVLHVCGGRRCLRPNQPKHFSARAWSLGAPHPPPPRGQCVSLLIKHPNFSPWTSSSRRYCQETLEKVME